MGRTKRLTALVSERSKVCMIDEYQCSFSIRAVPCPFWDKGSGLDASPRSLRPHHHRLMLVAFDGLRHRTPPPLSRTGGSSDKRSRALVDEGPTGPSSAFSQAGQQSGPDIRRTRRAKTSGIAAAPSAMAAVANVTVARDANRYAIIFCTTNDGRRDAAKPVRAQSRLELCVSE